MKYRIVFVISVIIILIAGLIPYTHAHPGKTDSNGGHYDRSTGEYHYHHGYSAHQHYDGECPYEFDDKTNHNSSSSSNNSNYNSGNSSSSSSSSSSLSHNSSNSNSSSNTKHPKYTITFGEVVMKIVMFFPFLFMSFCMLSIFNPFVNGTVDISNERTSRILYIAHIILCIITAIAMTIFIE